MKKLLLLPLLLFPIACNGMQVQEHPETGKPVVVHPESGVVVDPAPIVGTVGTIVGAVTGQPALGVLLTTLVGGLLARKMKKKSPTAS